VQNKEAREYWDQVEAQGCNNGPLRSLLSWYLGFEPIRISACRNMTINKMHT